MMIIKIKKKYIYILKIHDYNGSIETKKNYIYIITKFDFK